jgi:hypothetical protein
MCLFYFDGLKDFIGRIKGPNAKYEVGSIGASRSIASAVLCEHDAVAPRRNGSSLSATVILIDDGTANVVGAELVVDKALGDPRADVSSAPVPDVMN